MSDEKTKRIAIKLAGGPEKWAELPDEGREYLTHEVEEMREALAAPNAPDDTEKDEIIIKAIEENRAARIDDFINSDIGALFQNTIAQSARYSVNSVLTALGNLGKISPYYEALIENDQKYEALRGAHASVTLTPKDDAPEDVKGLHNLFVEAWAEAEEEYKKAQTEPLEKVQGRRVKKWLQPTDKNSFLFFGPTIARMSNDIPGQMSFVPELMNLNNSIPFDNGKRTPAKANKKNSNQAMVYLTYRYDDTTMQQLNAKWGDEYAKNFFITFAASNLYLAGNRKITLSQLFRAMPGKTSGAPSEAQLKSLFKNVLQCISTTVYMNTKEVSERWGIDRYKEIIGHVLPARWVNERITINGALADSYLEIYDVSPFFQLAFDMKQIQPVNIKVLEIKISRTETTYRVLYYLLGQVLWMQHRNSKRSSLITYNELYKEIGVNPDSNANRDKKKRHDVKEHCFNILEQWQKIGFISGYQETPEDKTPGIYIDAHNKLQLTD